MAELSRQMLELADCDLGLLAYRQRLALPLNASVIVSNQTTVLSEEEQANRAMAFNFECGRLVGKSRRSVVRCWLDSTDASTFVACNGRF